MLTFSFKKLKVAGIKKKLRFLSAVFDYRFQPSIILEWSKTEPYAKYRLLDNSFFITVPRCKIDFGEIDGVL